MARELQYLGNALEKPARPFVAILGGAKISGKIDVIEALRTKVDHLLIGGGMAFTFLAARGYEVGRSLVDEDRLEMAERLLKAAADGQGAPISLPVDAVVAPEMEPGVEHKLVPIDSIPENLAGYDVGEATLELWRPIIEKAQTIVWNGPLGVFEVPPFDASTLKLAQMIAGVSEAGAISVIGGGDSAAAVAAAGLTEKMSHVSTGGGASLEFLEGKELPGVAALTDKQ
jgi:phosphoglycerate kinase